MHKSMPAKGDILMEGDCAGEPPWGGGVGFTWEAPPPPQAPLAHLVAPSPARAGLFWLTSAGTAPAPLSPEALVEGTVVPLGTG